MGRIDDPNGDELADLKRRVRQLETRSPLSDSAVSGGRTRFIGQNSFLIEGSGGVSGRSRSTVSRSSTGSFASAGSST